MLRNLLIATLLVTATGPEARAALIDHGASGEYFLQESTGLFWFDPAEWFDTPRADVQAFVDGTTRWRWATSAEIGALVGEPAAEGTLQDVMGERSRSLTGNASRWHGFYAELDPSGWLVQDAVADGTVLASSGFQGGVENLQNAGAWLVADVDPEFQRITFDGFDPFDVLDSPYQEDDLQLSRVSCGSLIARFMPVNTPGLISNSNPCVIRLERIDGEPFDFLSVTLTGVTTTSPTVTFTGFYPAGGFVTHSVTLNNDFFQVENFSLPDTFRGVEGVELDIAGVFSDDYVTVPEPSIALALLPGVLLLCRLRSRWSRRCT